MIFNKALFLLGFLVICLFFSCAEPGNSEPYADRTIAFNEDWQFRLGDSVADPSQAEWRTLDLPHDWSIEGEFSPEHPAGVGGGALPGGLGWYRKEFKVDEADLS